MLAILVLAAIDGLLSVLHSHSGDFLLLCHLNHSYIINTTQFLLL